MKKRKVLAALLLAGFMTSQCFLTIRVKTVTASYNKEVELNNYNKNQNIELSSNKDIEIDEKDNDENKQLLENSDNEFDENITFNESEEDTDYVDYNEYEEDYTDYEQEEYTYYEEETLNDDYSQNEDEYLEDEKIELANKEPKELPSAYSLFTDKKESVQSNNEGLDAQEDEEEDIEFIEDQEENSLPVIEGLDDITINVGEKFSVREGVTAIDSEEGDLTSQIKVIGLVDINTPGTYELIYRVKDSSEEIVANVRYVTVMDTISDAPEITGVEDVSIDCYSIFNSKSNVIATDEIDGDLSKDVIIEGNLDTSIPGVYKLVYYVTNSRGLETKVIRYITVLEPINYRPELEVRDIRIKIGDKEADFFKGVKATDKEDGDITSNVEIQSDNLDLNVPGDYEVTYSIVDKIGNIVKKVAKITMYK